MKIQLSQFKVNMLSGSLVHGLNALIILMSYPIYIKYLGFQLFSVWTALSVVIAFAKMGEFGISQAIVAFISKEKSGVNAEKKILDNAFYILSVASILIFAILCLFKSPVISLLNIPGQYVEESTRIIPLMAIAIILFLYYDMLSGVISGKNRLDIVNILLLFNNLIKFIVSVLLLDHGLSLLAMVYSIIITNIILIIIQNLIIGIKFKIPVLRLTIPEFKYLKKLINFGASIMGIQFFNMLSLPLIKVILANSIGVEAVGVFELAYRPAYSIRTLFAKGLFAIMPDISKLSVSVKENPREKIRLRVNKLFRSLTLFSIPFFILVSAFAPFWLKLWLNESYSITILYGYWLLQPSIIVGLIILPYYYALLGTNNQRYCFYEAVIRAVLTILLCSLLFFIKLDIYYAFIIVSISVILSNLSVFLGFRNEFHEK